MSLADPVFAERVVDPVNRMTSTWRRWFMGLCAAVRKMETLNDPPTYADNAAALAGGLVSGDFYQTATGALMRVL